MALNVVHGAAKGWSLSGEQQTLIRNDAEWPGSV